jgi:hypothetical protein
MLSDSAEPGVIPSTREGRGLRQSLTMGPDDDGLGDDENDSLLQPVVEFAQQSGRRMSQSLEASASVVDESIDRDIRPDGGEQARSVAVLFWRVDRWRC